MTTGQTRKAKSNVWAGVGMTVCFLTATALLATGLARESASPTGKQPVLAIR